MNMAYASQAELNKNLTLAAWIKTTNSSRMEAFLSKYDTQGYGYVLRTTAGGTLALEIGTYNAAVYGNKIATDSAKINDGQWHHVAVTITLNSNVSFYVDGALEFRVSAQGDGRGQQLCSAAGRHRPDTRLWATTSTAVSTTCRSTTEHCRRLKWPPWPAISVLNTSTRPSLNLESLKKFYT